MLQKRRRVGFCCAGCYLKKVKCDGERPCQRCVRLGEESSCRDRSDQDVAQRAAQRSAVKRKKLVSVGAAPISARQQLEPPESEKKNTTTKEPAWSSQQKPAAAASEQAEPMVAAPVIHAFDNLEAKYQPRLINSPDNAAIKTAVSCIVMSMGKKVVPRPLRTVLSMSTQVLLCHCAHLDLSVDMLSYVGCRLSDLLQKNPGLFAEPRDMIALEFMSRSRSAAAQARGLRYPTPRGHASTLQMALKAADTGKPCLVYPLFTSSATEVMLNRSFATTFGLRGMLKNSGGDWGYADKFCILDISTQDMMEECVHLMRVCASTKVVGPFRTQCTARVPGGLGGQEECRLMEWDVSFVLDSDGVPVYGIRCVVNDRVDIPEPYEGFRIVRFGTSAVRLKEIQQPAAKSDLLGGPPSVAVQIRAVVSPPAPSSGDRPAAPRSSTSHFAFNPDEFEPLSTPFQMIDCSPDIGLSADGVKELYSSVEELMRNSF